MLSHLLGFMEHHGTNSLVSFIIVLLSLSLRSYKYMFLGEIIYFSCNTLWVVMLPGDFCVTSLLCSRLECCQLLTAIWQAYVNQPILLLLLLLVLVLFFRFVYILWLYYFIAVNLNCKRTFNFLPKKILCKHSPFIMQAQIWLIFF